MATARKLIVLGAGGVGLELVEIARLLQWEVVGFLDDNVALHGQSLLGVPVIGTIDEFTQFEDAHFVSSIGRPDKRNLRRLIRTRVAVPDERFATLIHPSAIVFSSAAVGAGCVIYSGCHVGAKVTIGRDVFMAFGTTIAHECTIGDHTVLASGVNLAGEVTVGSDVYIGTGCAVTHGVSIGNNTLLGIGSIITKSIPANTKLIQNVRSFYFPEPAIEE